MQEFLSVHVIGYLPPWLPDRETTSESKFSCTGGGHHSQSITRGTKAIKQKINEVYLLRWGACHKPVEENSLLRSLFVDKLQKELAVCLPLLWGVSGPSLPR